MILKKDVNSIGQKSATIDLTPTVRVWHFNPIKGNTTNMVLWKQSDHTIKYQFDTLLQAYNKAKGLSRL